MRPITFIFVIGTLLLTACGGSVTPRLPNSTRPTSVPASQSSNLPSTNSTVLFQDDFSNKNGGWDQQSSDAGGSDYGDGFYSILVKSASYSIWANPNAAPSFGDVAIDVDAVIANGPEDAGMGLICRYQDIDNFMHATVTADGYYGIVLVQNGQASVLTGQGQLATSAAINAGKTGNHIQLVCQSNQYSLFVNGQKLASVSDNTLTDGGVGLIANTFSTGGVDVHFSKYVVTAP